MVLVLVPVPDRSSRECEYLHLYVGERGPLVAIAQKLGGVGDDSEVEQVDVSLCLGVVGCSADVTMMVMVEN